MIPHGALGHLLHRDCEFRSESKSPVPGALGSRRHHLQKLPTLLQRNRLRFHDLVATTCGDASTVAVDAATPLPPRGLQAAGPARATAYAATPPGDPYRRRSGPASA